MTSVEAPAVCDHAADRWDDRTHPGSVAPETAWTEAHELALTLREFSVFDEGRVHRPTATVLFRKMATVVTVYSVRDEHVTTPAGRELANAVAAQFGIVGGETA